MPLVNFANRIGLYTLIKFVKKICDIYLKYQQPLIEYINDSSLSSDNKTTVIAWLNGAVVACSILVQLEFVYE